MVTISIVTSGAGRRRSMVEHDVQRRAGLRVRRRREARGWVREELARRAQVSVSLLAQLERGEANPSLATLVSVADAIGIPLAELVAAEEDRGAGLAHIEPTIMWQGTGGSRSALLVGASGGNEAELWRYDLEPADTYDGAAHPDGSEVLIHVLEGTVEVTSNDETAVIVEGGSVRLRSDVPHRYANPTSQRSTFVLVYTRASQR
jgi:transcriptional regulator with XRE-family HTH domain